LTSTNFSLVPWGYAVRRLVPSLAAVLALGLGACSSGTSTTTATSAAGGATQASAPVTPAAPVAGGSVDGTALGKKMADALVAAKSGKLTMTFASSGSATSTSAVSMSGTATSSFSVNSAGSMDSSVTMQIGGVALEAVVSGGAMYLKMPGLTATNGKPWIKLDPAGTDPISKQVGTQIAQAGDPRSALSTYENAKVSVVGTSGGVTQYRITELVVSGTPVTGETMLYVEDSTGRPVRSVTESMGVKATAEFSGWGEPVSIAVPPADQVGPPPGA
jgi:hypothetical protein